MFGELVLEVQFSTFTLELTLIELYANTLCDKLPQSSSLTGSIENAWDGGLVKKIGAPDKLVNFTNLLDVIASDVIV